MSPEKLGFNPVSTFVTNRSEIGVICATADVSTEVTCMSAPKFATAFTLGNDRTFAMTFAVTVTEKLLLAGM